MPRAPLRNHADWSSVPHMPTPDLLTVTQASAELHMPTRTLQFWIATGKVAATRLGDGQTSAYVIARSEVERLAAQRTEESA